MRATTTEEPYPVPAGGRRWTGRAFGMTVEAPGALAGLESKHAGGTRRTALDLTTADDLAARWEDDRAEPMFRQPLADGRPGLTLERHDSLGFRMFAHRYGHWLVAHGGTSIVTSPPEGLEPWLWERFLVGQILPFAALLQGIEVFHASAAVMDGRVVAVFGGSGVGKTSVGLNLVLGGLPFFTDDVLALEERDGSLVCHPGAGMANVRDAALRERLERGDSPGRILGRGSESLRVLLDRDERELPLAAVYFLDRSSDGPAPIFEPTADPYLLLSSTFNFVLRTPERLAVQLDTCARIAESAALFRVLSPRASTAAELAEAVARHAQA